MDDFEDLFKRNEEIDLRLPKPLKFIEDQVTMREFVQGLLSGEKMKPMSRKFHMFPSNANILYTYRSMILDNTIEPNIQFEIDFKGHKYRENSGVMVITVVLSPKPNGQDFSCEFNCHYCPKEPAHKDNGFQEQPRSYIFKEPGVRRANRNSFDAILQFRDRAKGYIVNGLPVDKIEIIILGGTWHSYPKEYREDFVRDLFYAANTLYDADFNSNPRAKQSVLEERKTNETTAARIIGLTIETRPDQITRWGAIEFREFGVTRIQLGVQHTSNKILKGINRRCSTSHIIKAIKILKDFGFKVDIHLMPDLPGSDYQTDLDMFKLVLMSPDLQADQWKIYPCMTVPWTEIKKWYDSGSYKPYAETLVMIDGIQTNPLIELLVKVNSMIHPWIRVNRIIRDIPDEYMTNIEEIKEGMSINGFSNVRQHLDEIMRDRGVICRCIRCREVKSKKITQHDLQAAVLTVRQYNASGGSEYFISFESPDNLTLYGFLRLRLSKNAGQYKEIVFPELVGSALIRELHVYGHVVEVAHARENKIQHFGFGTRLLKKAEEIAINANFHKISVIAGDGVKQYYRKKGFTDGKYYLHKSLQKYKMHKILAICLILICIIVIYL